MLVHFHKGFMIEGEATFLERSHFWSRPKEVRHKIYCYSYVAGICDRAELEIEIERLTARRLEDVGWGYKFHGWQRVVPYEESIEIAKNKGWDLADLPTGEITVELINQWKISKILDKLTGEQFAQFCKENSLGVERLYEGK